MLEKACLFCGKKYYNKFELKRAIKRALMGKMPLLQDVVYK
jgi:hypothetical protein